MSILVAVLASLGAAVIVLVAAFFFCVYVFERVFSSDEGLGIVWLAGVCALIAAATVLGGGVFLSVTA